MSLIRVSSLAVAALACVWACACGGDRATEPVQPPADPPRPTTVAVSPATSELTALDATVQLSAEVRDQNGQVMVANVTWASNNTSVATVDASGLVTAAGNGTATITATAGTVSGSAAVTVAQRVSAVEVAPATGVVLPGITLQLAAEAQDANGHAVDGSEFVWASSDTAVAVVDTTGLVAGITLGEVEVSATSSGATGRARLEVVEPAPTTVAVSPDTLMFEALGDTLRLAAEVQDQAGRPMPNEVVMWTAGDTLVATVTAAGVVTATGNGVATITATSGAASAEAAVEVMQVARRVILSPTADTLILGNNLRLAAEALDGNGHLIADVAFTWSSSDATIATVDTSGVVGGVGEGTAEITAATGNVRGVARLTVFSPDRAPLVALYSATNGSRWVDNDNWLTDKPLAQWHGVRTDASGRVDFVNLTGRLDSQGNWTRHGLKGTIPPELGRLDKLRVLLLYGNELSGTVPAALGDLANLEQLDLSDNDLAGPIPPELGGLVKLKHFLFHNNDLEGPLPSELGNLARLEILSIRNNYLSGPIPAELGGLSTLKNLDLRGNTLGGPIPSELGGLAGLQQLYLHNNELTGPIPPELGRLTNLTRLWLYGNSLSGPIPSEIGNLTKLQGMVLYGNELTGPIPPELGNLHALTALDLSGNDLAGPVPARLGDLTALEYLLLQDNELEGLVPSAFGALTALQQLNLTNNNGMKGALPVELTALTRLDFFLTGGTQLCVPSEVDFERWLGGIYRRRIARCPEASASTAYLVQAVQSREFPVPVVADKEALLRVFVTARQATRQGIPPVRARFFVNDRETHVQDIAGKRSPIPTGVDESSLGRSANAVIPGNVIQPGLEMVIEVDPAGTLDPGLGVARRIPETGRLRVDVHDMHPLDLTLIPFIWSEDPDESIVELVREMAADPRKHEMFHDTRTLLPIEGLEVRAHEPVTFPTNKPLEILLATRAIRVMEGGTGYYKGMMSGNLGGIAFRPGWSSFSSPHGPTLAHELGHNMNLQHAPCGGAANPDPAYPHAEGAIGAWGFDFRKRSLIHPSVKDMMTYCGDSKWVSDFYFSNALRHRLRYDAQPALPVRVAQTRSLLLWGGLDTDGKLFLEPAFVIDAPAVLPDAAGDYRLTGRAPDGAELFSLSFAMPDVPDGGGSSAFVFAVPVQAVWEGTLVSITLSGPDGSVALDGNRDRAMAIVLDPGSGQVRGFFRDTPAEEAFQTAAMAAPGSGTIEVLFSRGIPDAAAWRR